MSKHHNNLIASLPFLRWPHKQMCAFHIKCGDRPKGKSGLLLATLFPGAYFKGSGIRELSDPPHHSYNRWDGQPTGANPTVRTEKGIDLEENLPEFLGPNIYFFFFHRPFPLFCYFHFSCARRN